MIFSSVIEHLPSLPHRGARGRAQQRGVFLNNKTQTYSVMAGLKAKQA